MLDIFYKEAVNSCKHKNYKFWENEYYPIELFNNEIMSQKLDYIHQNPVKEGVVLNPEDFYYSSARSYAGYKDGLLAIKFIG